MSISKGLQGILEITAGTGGKIMSGEIGFGQKIVRLRGNTSQKEIARRIGISVTALQAYEMNERIPRDEVKLAIARYFNISVNELFFN